MHHLILLLVFVAFHPLSAQDKTTPPQDLQTAVAELKKGMSIGEAAEILRPFTLANARTLAGITGLSTRLYHLKGDWQVAFEVNDDKELLTSSKFTLEPKLDWNGYLFKPDVKTKKVAIEIAVKAIQKELDEGNDPAKRFDTSELTHHLLPKKEEKVELQTKGGAKKTYNLAAELGQYRKHRLLTVNFLEGKEWVYSVIVDLEDKIAVPAKWVPSKEEIEAARKIVDPQIKEYLNQPGRPAMVNGWGKYEFAPLRRMLILNYYKPDAKDATMKIFVVDMESKKVVP